MTCLPCFPCLSRYDEMDALGGDNDAPPKLDKRKVKKMKPAQLKEELKLRGLSIQGNAKELVARLTEAAC